MTVAHHVVTAAQTLHVSCDSPAVRSCYDFYRFHRWRFRPNFVCEIYDHGPRSLTQLFNLLGAEIAWGLRSPTYHGRTPVELFS